MGDTRPTSRNADNFKLTKTRTETFKKSFIPSSIKIWNQSQAKNQTPNHADPLNNSKGNILFYEGPRDVNIKHAQLRMKCSKLNSHLFLLHVADSPACSCGFDNEDTNHYLLNCPLFNNERHHMLQAVFLHVNTITRNTLLFGCEELDHQGNLDIFTAVHHYINTTKRL